MSLVFSVKHFCNEEKINVSYDETLTNLILLYKKVGHNTFANQGPIELIYDSPGVFSLDRTVRRSYEKFFEFYNKPV